jgi:hypothetical protein
MWVKQEKVWLSSRRVFKSPDSLRVVENLVACLGAGEQYYLWFRPTLLNTKQCKTSVEGCIAVPKRCWWMVDVAVLS